MDIEKEAKEWRAIKAYELLYEKKDVTELELQFLMFLAEDCENQKLARLIKEHKRWKQKKTKK